MTPQRQLNFIHSKRDCDAALWMENQQNFTKKLN